MAEYLCEEDMSTGEYISRDVALRQLNATCLATDCNNYNGVMCRACAYADAMDFIEAIPAADVQPVKRGEWKYYKNNGIIDTYICTNCQGKVEMTIDVESSKFKYCPNCGARMDLGDEKT